MLVRAGRSRRAARTSVVVRGLRADAREDDLVDRVVVLPQLPGPARVPRGAAVLLVPRGAPRGVARHARFQVAGDVRAHAPRAIGGGAVPAAHAHAATEAVLHGPRALPATPATGREGAERAGRGVPRRGPRARVERPPARYTSRVFWERGVASEATRGWAGVRSAARAKKEQVVARVGQTDASRGRVVSLDRGRSVARRPVHRRFDRIEISRAVSSLFPSRVFARCATRDATGAALARTIARETYPPLDLPGSRLNTAPPPRNDDETHRQGARRAAPSPDPNPVASRPPRAGRAIRGEGKKTNNNVRRLD